MNFFILVPQFTYNIPASHINLCMWSYRPTLTVTFVSALTDLDDSSSLFGLDPPPVKLDHCDLLLDAIDAQLSQLQVCVYSSAVYYLPIILKR